MRDAGCCGQSRIMVEGEQSHPSSNYSLERPEIDEIVKTVGNTRKLRSEGSILKKGGQVTEQNRIDRRRLHLFRIDRHCSHTTHLMQVQVL